MSASQPLSEDSVAFPNERRPSSPLEPLQGRWLCRVTAGPRSRIVAVGVFDIVRTGSYLVGSGRGGGPPPQAPPGPGAAWDGVASLEGSLFGAVRGDEVVLWITDRLGSAVWVLEGSLEAPANTIAGLASYTDLAHASEGPLEAGFSLTRL
jgi:hypothetical protein